MHVGVGKLSFTDEQLAANINALMHSLLENKPSGVKGKLIQKMVVAPTMGPSVQVNRQE